MKKVDVAGGGHVTCWDSGSGQALVAVHGGATPGELLRMDLAELSRECRVIVYDRRGWGESSESPRSWTAHRDDAIALIDQLGAAPAVIFGYSVGSLVALGVALERPESVAGLVLLDPVVAFAGRGLGRTRLKTKLLRVFRDDRAAAESWIQAISAYTTGEDAWEKAVPDRRERILANASGILADLDTPEPDHLDAERLAALETPITILGTELSPPFIRDSVERARALLPQARFVTLEKSSHVAFLDARDQVLTALRDALSAAAAR